MSYFITSIIYFNKEFKEEAFYEALKQVEEFPVPHPNPIEKFTKIPLNSDITAIYYQVGGYNTKSKCFSMQCELFREDGFPDMINQILKDKGIKYRFYSHLYCEMDGFLENTKYTERGFEIWQRMDGEAMHFFKEEDKPVQTEILNLKKEADENSLDSIFDELGITEEDMIQAFHRLEKEGVILAEFKK
jgi:hypothetical protein